LKAEKVGENAADAIIAELRSGAGVDEFLADQFDPLHWRWRRRVFNYADHFLCIPKTNIWVTEQFLPVKFKIEESETGLFRVWV